MPDGIGSTLISSSVSVRRDGQGSIEFFRVTRDGGSWEYSLPEADVSTRRGLIRTISFLCDKRWIKTSHIRGLIAISYDVAAK